jgi:hypothetical protein
MRLLPGRLFNSLSYQVDKQIKESLYENEVFLNSCWGFIEKSIVQWSTYYKKYILLALLLATLIIINGVLWQPWVMIFIPDRSELFEWQGVVLGGQLTVIGVVYPLVVALISILFQNKSAKKIIFPIYQKYSGFMFAGLSGLTLSCFIVAGFLVRPMIGEHIYVAVCITSALWLFSNLLLTAWFFVKTFRMLDENSREAIVFRFSIHEAGEVDVRRRIKKVLLDNAVHNNLMVNHNNDVMEVMNYKYSSDAYSGITRKVKREEGVKDVRFWLLNTAIWLQVYILKLKKVRKAKLVVNPFRANRTDDEMIVARYYGFVINPVVKVLIKLSFSFIKEVPQVEIGLSSVLNGFVGPANDALRDNDVKEFTEATNKLSLWHLEIAQALSFKNNDGNLDNWLLLTENGMWGRDYLNELLREYRQLAREAVKRIPETSHFYTEVLHLHKRIFFGRDSLIKQEIYSLIQGSYYMWYLLVEWRSYSSESRDLRIANKYEDILYDFVGAWEDWLMFIEPRSKRTGDIDKVYPAFIVHLEFTASTVISALRFDNFEAAGWGVDMLINWLGKLSRDDHWHLECQWRSNLINHNFLSFEPDSEIWQLIVKDSEYDHLAAFDLSFKNAHIDLRVITACYMLIKPGDDKPDQLVKYIKALLSGTRIHPSSSVGQSHDITNAGELLGAYIRHRDYRPYGEVSYGDWLSSILGSFGRLYEERRISGRIYSGWGASDPRSMNTAYVQIALSMSVKPWTLSREWEEALLSDYFRHMDRESIISDLREWINIAREKQNSILIEPDDLESYKVNFIKSIEVVIKKIGEVHNDTIVNAKIDHDRLIQFGVAGSIIFRKEDKPLFPLVLFEHINRDSLLDESCCYQLTITNYLKEEVALGLYINRDINEYEHMEKHISEKVKLNIIRELLQYPHSDSYTYIDITSALSDILVFSNTVACPVLFVGNQALKGELRRSAYKIDISKRYNISHQDGFSNEYLCHVGRCEVYSLSYSDIDYCLFTSKELFNTLTFRKIDDDRYVDVDFEPDEGAPEKGKLIMKYFMKVDLATDTPCIRLDIDKEK